MSVKDFKCESVADESGLAFKWGVAPSRSSELLTGTGVQTDRRAPATVIEYKPEDR